MSTPRRGQVLVIVAIALVILLLLLAVVIDAGRLFVERQELAGVADAAAKAGMVVVGDRMVTLAAQRQTEAAALPQCTPDAGFGTPGAVCTATPPPGYLGAWLTDADRAELVSPAMQTPVASAVIEYAERNGFGPSNPDISEFTVDYPHDYQPEDRKITLLARLRRTVEVLLVGLLGNPSVEISAESSQGIDQR